MHIARITEVRDWSRLLPTRNPDEVINQMQRSELMNKREAIHHVNDKVCVGKDIWTPDALR